MAVPKITIYDKNFARQGWLGDATQVTATPRFNKIGNGSIVIPEEHPKADLLLTEGARITIEHRGQLLQSGMITGVDGEGPLGSITFQYLDDMRLLWNVLGWPNPESPLSNQSASAYRTISGSAEHVLKSFVSENAERLGLPVTVAPNVLHRGDTITVKMRMHPLADRLLPIVEQAGLGVSIIQSGAGLLVDVYEPQDFPLTLSVKAGTVLSYNWSRTSPLVTRNIVGGGGEGTARKFRQVDDPAAEALWGDVIETVTDARDTLVDAELDARGFEAVTEGAATNGLKIVLSETQTFQYGPGGIRIGDRVPINIGRGTVTDVLREATLVFDENGDQVTPTVGERTNDPNLKVASLLSKALRQNRSVRVDYDPTVTGPDAVWTGPVTGPVEGGFEGEWID